MHERSHSFLILKVKLSDQDVRVKLHAAEFTPDNALGVLLRHNILFALVTPLCRHLFQFNCLNINL